MKTFSITHGGLLCGVLWCGMVTLAVLKTPLFAVAENSAASLPAMAPALRTRVASIEKRVALLRGELSATDNRIEERIDNMIEALRSVADSNNSRTKVARMKEQTIAELRRSIDDCQRRRATLQEELRRPMLNLTEEQKRWGVAAFDAHIEKRISQIIELYQSLPQHEDYEKYKVVPGGGWFGTLYVENEDWKQNQRVVSHTNATRQKIVDGFRDSISRLQRQNDSLQAQLTAAKVESERNAIAEEMGRNEAILLKRREQLGEVLNATVTPVPGITLRQAMTLDAALNEAIAGLRTETNTLYRYYSEYINELVSLNASKAVLAAAEAGASRKTK